MVHPVKLGLVTALAVLLAGAGNAGAKIAVRIDHVTLSSMVEKPATPGSVTWVAIRQTISPGWHTYWKNPGDSGLPTMISWILPNGMTAGAAIWPTPERFATDSIVNFGYRGAATMLVPITLSPKVVPGVIKAKISLLECGHICIPEEESLDIDLRRSFGQQKQFAQARADIPPRFPGWARVSTNQGNVVLTLNGAVLKRARSSDIQFYPATPFLVDYGTKPVARFTSGELELVFRPAVFPKAFQTFSGVIVIAGIGSYDIAAENKASSSAAATAKP